MAASDGPSVSFPSSESRPCVQLSGGHTGVSLLHSWIPKTSFKFLIKTAGLILTSAIGFHEVELAMSSMLAYHWPLALKEWCLQGFAVAFLQALAGRLSLLKKMNEPVKLCPLHEQNCHFPAATRACFCGSLSRLTVQDILNSRKQFFFRLDRAHQLICSL